MANRKITVEIDVVANDNGSKKVVAGYEVIAKVGKGAAKEIADKWDIAGRMQVESAKQVEKEHAKSAKNIIGDYIKVVSENKKAEDSKRKESGKTEREYSASLKRMEAAGRNYVRETQNQAEKTRSAFGGVFAGSFLGNLAAAGARKVVQALNFLPGAITEVFSKSMDFSQMSVSLAQFEGSVDNAQNKIRELIKVAAETPGLSFVSAVEGQKRLEAVGFESEKATNILRGLAKIRVLSGASKEDFDAMLVNLVQIASGGQKVTQEIREMATRMPYMIGIIRKEFGTVGKALNDIDPKVFIDRLAKASAETEVAFASSALAVENFQDAIDRLYIAVGSVIEQNPEVVALFRLWAGEIDGTSEALANQDSQQRKTFSNFISWLAEGAVKVQNFASLVAGISQDIGMVIGNAASAFNNYINLLVGKMRASVDFGVEYISDKMNSLIRFTNGVGGALSTLGINIPQISEFKADVGETKNRFYDTLPKEYEEAEAARKRYFNFEGGYFSNAEKAYSAGVNRLSKFYQYSLEEADAIKKLKNRQFPKNTLPSETPGGGGKGKKSRLSEAGIEGFANDRVKAQFQRAMAKLSPELKTRIIQAAAQYGIPEALAFAQIFSESSFNPSAKSPFNKNVGQSAFGLTQVLPSTASSVLGRKTTGNQLFNTETALEAWGKYMNGLFDEFGDWEMAVFAYHNGEGAARQFIKALDSTNKDRVGRFVKGNPKGIAYAKKIGGLAGLSGDAQFQTTTEIASSEAEKEAAKDLERAKERILKLSKELGLSEADYAATNQQAAESTISRLETIKDIQRDWSRETESTTDKLRELNTVGLSESDRLQMKFNEMAKAAGLTASEVAFLNSGLEKLKAGIKQLEAAEQKAKDAKELVEAFEDAKKSQDENTTRRNESSDDLLRQMQGDYSGAIRQRDQTNYERAAEQIAELERQYGKLDDAKKQDILNTAAQTDAAEKFYEVQGKVQGFFENIFDKAFSGKFKSILDEMLDNAKQFAVKLAAMWATQNIMSKLFGGNIGGGQQQGGFSIGSLFGGLFGGGQQSGGGLNLGSIFGGNAGGGIFNLVGGGAQGNASGVSSILGGKAGFLGKIGGLFGGLFGGGGGAMAATHEGAHIAGAAGGGLGSTLGSLGGLFTNPYTAIPIIAAIGGYSIFKLLKRGGEEKRLKKAAQSEFGIDVKDKSVLKSLKAVGNSQFGKIKDDGIAKQTVQSEDGQNILEEYAERTGQKSDKLNKKYLGDENYSSNISGRSFGGDNYISSTSSAIPSPSFTPDFSRATPFQGINNQMSQKYDQMIALLNSMAQTNDQISENTSAISSASPGDVLTKGAQQNPAIVNNAVNYSLKNGGAVESENFYRNLTGDML